MKLSPKIPLELARNNFDLMRLVFAIMVLLVHIAELSFLKELNPITHFISSSLAVKCFFIISGFLIVRSFHNTRSLRSYFEKRFKRIYPAYFFVVLSCSFLLFWISDLNYIEYFSIEWLRYVVYNLSFLNFVQPSLPGVFEGLKTSAVNGALWTLKVEVMFYIFVPFMVFACARFNKLNVLLVLYTLSILYTNLMSYQHFKTGNVIYLTLMQQFPGQLSYFLGGTLLFYYFEFFSKYMTRLVICAVALLAFKSVFMISIFEPLALSVIVLFLATYCYLGNFTKYGDLSYGIYIIHFPVIQYLLKAKIFNYDPVLFLLTALALTLIGSFFLWHSVEKLFLAKSSRYISTV